MLNENIFLTKMLPLLTGCMLIIIEFFLQNRLGTFICFLLFFILGLFFSQVIYALTKNLISIGCMALVVTALPTLLLFISFLITPANTYNYSSVCFILINWVSVNLFCFTRRLFFTYNEHSSFSIYSRFVGVLFISSYTVLMLLMLFSNSFSSRAGSQTVNLIPFKTINLYITALVHSDLRIAVINILGNILLFVPLGFYLRAFLKKPTAAFLTAALIPLSIEMIQYILRAGVADIDDIILNVIGELIGFLCLFLADFVYGKYNTSSDESFLGF